jgi:hypothetical protein
MPFESRSRTSLLSLRDIADHFGKAFFAAEVASATSSRFESGIKEKATPFEGSIFSI